MRLCSTKHCNRTLDDTQNYNTCAKCRERSRKYYYLKKGFVVTAEHLRKILHYDPETGQWHWRVKPNKRQTAGSRAGHLTTSHLVPRGRWKIHIHGTSYDATRLAFLYMTGRYPEPSVIHINLDTSDDRWINLKEGETQHRITHRDKKSKLPLGVTRNGKNGNSYMAQCSINYERHYIGTYRTPEEAEQAYLAFVARNDPNRSMLTQVNPDIKEKGEWRVKTLGREEHVERFSSPAPMSSRAMTRRLGNRGAHRTRFPSVRSFRTTRVSP